MANLLARAQELLLELRRRNVTRVAFAYLLASWVSIQVANEVFPLLGIPPWSAKLVVALVIVGFPVALALAWAFEITNDGVRREKELALGADAGTAPALSSPPVAAPPETSPRLDRLPAPSTPLVGRRAELAEIDARLGDPATRLVTLLGPGGVGKTRLALEAAAQLSDRFEHGVAFVALGETEPEEPLAAVIACQLDVPTAGHADPAVPLLAFLRHKSLFLLLDNFDHLTRQAPLIGELLAGAPGVRALCTSRERLGLHAEILVPVEGLPQGGADGSDDAGELFFQAARRVHPAFAPTPDERAAIAQICRSVQGLPLALELAAAWVGVLSCTEIAAEIERNKDFLVTSLRDLPERHRSLRAVFDWSWRLLPEEERRAFRRLSVFRGGFTRETAEAVTGTPLPVLSSLADRSLVAHRAPGRFEILGVLRQYAAERLADDPLESRSVAEAHGRHFAAFLEQARPRMEPAVDPATVAVVAREIDNVREAWRWMVREGRAEEIERSLHALHLFFYIRGWAREGCSAFEQAVEGMRAHPGASAWREVLLGRLVSRQAIFCTQLGCYEDARALLREALAIFSTTGERTELALALERLGVVEMWQGEYEAAEATFREAYRLYSELDDPKGVANALLNLGTVASLWHGENAKARELYQQSLVTARRVGAQAGISLALKNLGRIAYLQKAFGEARAMLEESLAIEQTLDNRPGIANTLQNLGCIALGEGDHRGAEGYLMRGIEISREMGFRRWEAYCTNELANVYLAEERLDEARQLYFAALRAAHDIREYPAAMQFLIGLARVLHRRGEAQPALELLGLVLRHPRSEQSTREEAREAWSVIAGHPPGGEVEVGDADINSVLQQLLDAETGVPASGLR